ncbi:DNA-binding protein, putative [Trichomonas vaginalis G3]|uniref:DNA-binding protein, putative n=1 Tax=Trichomonas vaginalis (strain ATCC PRA-98 / G3) TaxID=412133 RepID=A2E378_TRIV3|nr:protein of unknown function (DUF296) [Trichomonas vaginalis G3]EAY12888.1 DNA-binding protein, putative [Trichomonas vaginalis G3]KAI5491943.1 protein of unknown function (DUF296) [Trichomonas vaginalis G3]|eukprot:XP_001325111.1 DNA-binding protein [Trichomonas vaginalis G3]
MSSGKGYIAFRLRPGEDLYTSIQEQAVKNGCNACAIVTCVGSLKECHVRLAGATATDQVIVPIPGPLEIVSLTGTISQGKAHIHISVSDNKGQVFGGHLVKGSLIETTAEIVLVNLNNFGIQFTREFDQATGFNELVVKYDN